MHARWDFDASSAQTRRVSALDKHRKKYTSGPRYWNVPVLVNTGTFLVYQYCLKMWYLRSLEQAGVIQKLTILECKNCLVLSNTHVPVSGTSSILFPKHQNWSASALFCLNSRAQSKYAVVNLIHTRLKQTFLSCIIL